MQVKITSRGIPEAIEYIKSVPRGAKITAMRAIITYIIGNEQHGLKHEPAYRYVSPFQSYSMDPVKAARQRGWIFTHLDQIGQDNRTHEIANGWQMTESNSDWSRVNVTNDADGLQWVMGDGQSRHSAAAGWRKWRDIIETNLAGAIQAGQRAVDAWLSSKGRV